MLSFSFSTIRREIINDMGHLRFASGKLHYLMGDTETSIRNYLESIRYKLGNEDSHNFPLDYYQNDKNGTSHFLFQQVHENIPVFGRYIHIHTQNKMITNISSNIDNINSSFIPLIHSLTAMDIIQQYVFSPSDYLKYQKEQI